METSNHFVIKPPKTVAIPVAGGGVFPVGRVYCVGRNYAGHAREMGSDPDREPPFFFSKPATAICTDAQIPYPPRSNNLHHEVELVVALVSGGRDIPVTEALGHVFGYAVGVDLTRRDLQAEAKKHARPWEMAKGFDFSAPISKIGPIASVGHPESGALELKVNGRTRQRGDINQMIWSPGEIIAELSSYLEIQPGDLIFTGTPEGVGPLSAGDCVEVCCGDLLSHRFRLE